MAVIIEEGTARWFEVARHRCIDHLRALHSIRAAHSFIVRMLRDWLALDAVINASLHSACVVAYARPFTTSRTRDGKVSYPLGKLRRIAGFDADFHAHLMDLRNRIIAHADYGVFPSTMYVQAIGDEKLLIRLGLNVKGMIGIESRALAEKYETHVSAAAVTVEGALNRECSLLAEHARRYPDAFESTHNLPISRQEVEVGLSEQSMPGPSGQASLVEQPKFPDELSGYRYLMLTHQIALVRSGTYLIHENGTAKKITFSVQ